MFANKKAPKNESHRVARSAIVNCTPNPTKIYGVQFII